MWLALASDYYGSSGPIPPASTGNGCLAGERVSKTMRTDVADPGGPGDGSVDACWADALAVLDER